MSHQIANLCKADITKFIKDESENLAIIRAHIHKLNSAKNARKLSNLFGFSNTDQSDDKSISEIRLEIYERCKFDLSVDIDQAHLELLDNASHISDIENDLVEIFDNLDEAQKAPLATLVALKEGGRELLEVNKIIDLKLVQIPITYNCPLCETDNDLRLSVLALNETYTVKSNCSNCGHSVSENSKCECAFCAKNKNIFDLAKLLNESLKKTIQKADKRIKLAIDKEEIVENDVDLLNLFAKFTSFRSSLSKEAKQVVESVISCYSITGEFAHNTYQFTQNIVGENNASKISSELYKAGFFYKAGFIPKNNNMGIPPSFGIKSKADEHLIYDINGRLLLANGDNVTNYDEATLYISKDFAEEFYVFFNVQPYMRSVFKVNQYILEHDVHGGIISGTKSEEKHEFGSILKNKGAREAYLEEKQSGEYSHIFPDIRIGRLIDLEDLRRIMISSTLTILEGFEASIVCYDDQFEPRKVYLQKTSRSIDVIKNSVIPMLTAKGIEVVLL